MKGRDNRTNHSNQMNPNNDAYWQARGYNERPGNWEDQLVLLDDLGYLPQGAEESEVNIRRCTHEGKG